MDVAKTHVKESDHPEQANHVLHKALRDTLHCQTSSQRGGEERNECRIVRGFLKHVRLTLDKDEVLQVLKEPDEVYDLSIRSFGFFKAEKPEGWQEGSKVLLNLRHEILDVKEIYPKVLDID